MDGNAEIIQVLLAERIVTAAQNGDPEVITYTATPSSGLSPADGLARMSARRY